MIRFTSNTFAVEAAGPDGENRRTITGIAVPYNTFATVSDGTTVQFMPGSLPVEGKAPKVIFGLSACQCTPRRLLQPCHSNYLEAPTLNGTSTNG